jgi:hypothetical protein
MIRVISVLIDERDTARHSGHQKFFCLGLIFERNLAVIVTVRVGSMLRNATSR